MQAQSQAWLSPKSEGLESQEVKASLGYKAESPNPSQGKHLKATTASITDTENIDNHTRPTLFVQHSFLELRATVFLSSCRATVNLLGRVELPNGSVLIKPEVNCRLGLESRVMWTGGCASPVVASVSLRRLSWWFM